MSNVFHLVELGALGLLTAAIITFTVTLAVVSGDLVNPNTNGFQEYVNHSSSIDTKNNTLVNGSAVRKMLKDYSLDNNCSVVVYTKRCPRGFFLDTYTSDLNSDFYINPAANFYLTLLHDTDRQVVQICCTEVGVDSQPVIQTNPELPAKFLQKVTDLENENTSVNNHYVVPNDLADAYFEYRYYQLMYQVLGGM